MARGAVRLHAAAFGLPDRRRGHPGDQMDPAAVRRPRLRRADGTGVRRPPRRGRQSDALGPPARPDGGRADDDRSYCPAQRERSCYLYRALKESQMTTASTSMAAAPYQELATAPGRMAGTPRRTDLPVRLLADGQLAHQEQRT